MTAPWYADFAASIAAGEPSVRACEACDAVGLPPRQTCSACGQPEMVDAPLSTDAEVIAHTEIGITIPKFADHAPYTVVIAAFDEGVRLTGQLRGDDEIERGDRVALGVEEIGEVDWVITFTPTE